MVRSGATMSVSNGGKSLNVSVIIATYGEKRWADLARTRALPSTDGQGPCDILIGHDPDGTISSVRNQLAEKALGDWLCFLDGDDELAPGYLDAMGREREGHDGNFLLTPAISYVVDGRWQNRHFQKQMPLRDGNWLTIGTLIPKALFFEIGGFRNWGLYEDWDLWARCGCPIVKVPDALYLAHYSRTSRNRRASRAERNYWHQMIGHDLWPDYYDAPSGAEHTTREVAGVRKLALA